MSGALGLKPGRPSCATFRDIVCVHVNSTRSEVLVLPSETFFTMEPVPRGWRRCRRERDYALPVARGASPPIGGAPAVSGRRALVAFEAGQPGGAGRLEQADLGIGLQLGAGVGDVQIPHRQ